MPPGCVAVTGHLRSDLQSLQDATLSLAQLLPFYEHYAPQTQSSPNVRRVLKAVVGHPNATYGLHAMAVETIPPAPNNQASGALERVAHITPYPDLQGMLTRCSNTDVRWYLARNPRLAGVARDVLANDRSGKVLSGLVRANHAAEGELLPMLARLDGQSRWLTRAIAARSNDTELLDALLICDDAETISNAVRRLPVDRHPQLSRHPDARVRVVVAEHTTDPHLNAALADDPDAQVRATAIRHTADAAVVDSHAHDPSAAVLAVVAARTTTPEIHALLAEHHDPVVRGAVAEYATSRTVHALLARDPHLAVRTIIADESPHLDVVDMLADDAAPRVVIVVAKRSQNPDVLARLAQHPDRWVRAAVAANPHTPDEWQVCIALSG